MTLQASSAIFQNIVERLQYFSDILASSSKVELDDIAVDLQQDIL